MVFKQTQRHASVRDVLMFACKVAGIRDNFMFNYNVDTAPCVAFMADDMERAEEALNAALVSIGYFELAALMNRSRTYESDGHIVLWRELSVESIFV